MDLMLNKEHLTKQGFIKILSIKAVFPKGLNENIIAAFPPSRVFLYYKKIM